MCPALQQRLCGTLRPRRAKKRAKKTDKETDKETDRNTAKKNHMERTVADVRMAIANHSGLLHPLRLRASRSARRSPHNLARTTAMPRTSRPFCCGR
jgi:BRCT domain type II-containing protein